MFLSVILIEINTIQAASLINEVSSEITEATVFFKGAQITRKAAVITKGSTDIVKLTGLSPYIDKNSIRVKADKNVTILSVNHQNNYVEKNIPSETIREINEKIMNYEDEIQTLETGVSVLDEEMTFLKSNKQFVGDNTVTDPALYKQMSDLYIQKIKTNLYSKLEKQNEIKNLLNKIRVLKTQYSDLLNQEKEPSSEIEISVKSEEPVKTTLVITYLVENASWYPSYNIRIDKLNEPVQLIYKANLQQKTGIDWKNVKLTFSSATPNRSGIVPILNTNYLSYRYTSVSEYQNTYAGSSYVTGRITDVMGNPMPGVNVIQKGTANGTISDINGEYKLYAPANGVLEYSFLGYLTKQVTNSGSPVLDVTLTEDMVSLDEVVVVGYGTMKKSYLTGAVSSVSVTDDSQAIYGSRADNALQGRTSGVSVHGIASTKSNTPTIQNIVDNKVSTNSANVEFAIDIPYTVPADGKEVSIDMRYFEIPAQFEYHCVPKIDPDAFLMAVITNYNSLNLLNGRANLYFENTFVGRSYLNLDNINDTLKISMGRDKNIIVKREIKNEYNSIQTMGNNKVEVRNWKYTVKNNKNQDINIVIFDQVPVSIEKDIKVDEVEINDGKLTGNTGIIEWKYNMEADNSKEFEMSYQVKYPKYMNLIIQ